MLETWAACSERGQSFTRRHCASGLAAAAAAATTTGGAGVSAPKTKKKRKEKKGKKKKNKKAKAKAVKRIFLPVLAPVKIRSGLQKKTLLAPPRSSCSQNKNWVFRKISQWNQISNPQCLQLESTLANSNFLITSLPRVVKVFPNLVVIDTTNVGVGCLVKRVSGTDIKSAS